MPENPAPESRSIFSRFTNASPIGKTGMAIGAIIGLFVLTLLISLIIAIAFGESTGTANTVAIIRDLFIILLALQGILIGVAFLVLILQVAALLNLLQNEISPIIESLQDTANTVKGTSEFLRDNAAAPVIESQAWLAGVATFLRAVTRKQASKEQKSEEANVQEEPT